MVLLCVIWGFQQVAIKLAAADIAPLLQSRCARASSRCWVARCCSGSAAGRVGWATWDGGALTGVLFGLELFFIALGLQYTSASHRVVFSLQLKHRSEWFARMGEAPIVLSSRQ